MARFVLTGSRREPLENWSACVYISKNGCITYNAQKAAVHHSWAEAQAERDYWNGSTGAPKYRWIIEQLPPRLPVASAILRAQPVSETEVPH